MSNTFNPELYGEFQRFIQGLGEDNSDQRRRLRRNMAAAIREELTERQAQMVRMYYGSGMKMPAIARELGVNVSTVSRTLSRARVRLRRCIRYGAAELLRPEE